MIAISKKVLDEAIRCDSWPTRLHDIVEAVNKTSDEGDLSLEQCLGLAVLLDRALPHGDTAAVAWRCERGTNDWVYYTEYGAAHVHELHGGVIAQPLYAAPVAPSVEREAVPVAWTSRANLKVAREKAPFYQAVMGPENTPEMNVPLYTHPAPNREAVPTYAQIIEIVNECSERMKASGESHRMLAKWISEGIHAALPRDTTATRAQWSAFNSVLHYLNTLENKLVDKREIYAAIMEMRPSPGVIEDPADFVLLMRLQEDNVWNGSRRVTTLQEAGERDQVFRLSEDGMIAMEQLASGVCLHITRRGTLAVTATLDRARASTGKKKD